MHTPYGATECLPVSTIEAAEVIGETAAATDRGAGVCVGRKFSSIDWRVIRITDDPIATMDDAVDLPTGEIGELVVRGPQVSPTYATGTNANATAKIAPTNTQYSVLSTPYTNGPPEMLHGFPPETGHRTGDVGYLDDQGRFWYCGRKSQRVETPAGTMYTEMCEAICNKHPAVRRSALVGVGPRGYQKPVMILEVNRRLTEADQDELQQTLTNHFPAATHVKIMPVSEPLPVDIRHNAKINREKLATWTKIQVKRATG
jgi:acyl-CoA synthetase (AMP-forming)/AMP-acid ligase II